MHIEVAKPLAAGIVDAEAAGNLNYAPRPGKAAGS
jgi:hypothetical protein